MNVTLCTHVKEVLALDIFAELYIYNIIQQLNGCLFYISLKKYYSIIISILNI